MIERDTTGGWLWHMRAFFRRRQWRPTTELIAGWLDGVQPSHRELLLIGGSAGWMMSSRWLQQFERIVLIDIDRYAPALFRWNHGRALRQSSTRLEFLQRDGLRDLEALLSAYPNASIFFDNVLGQHVYRVPDFDQAERELNQMAQRLAGRDWGSLHDLFSGPANPKALPAKPVISFAANQSALGTSVDGVTGTPLHRRLLAQVGGFGEWMDHVTSGVFPLGSGVRLIAWPFVPTYVHWLQAGWVNLASSND
jgi:hypothetical protein